MIVIRLRSRQGTWRFQTQKYTKLHEFISTVETMHGINIKKLSYEQNFSQLLDLKKQGSLTLDELGIDHGDMLYIDMQNQNGSNSVVAPFKKIEKFIDKDGNLVSHRFSKLKNAFRPGLQSLRTQKLHWSLTDMIEFDNKYTYEIKSEPLNSISCVSLNSELCKSFQNYVRNYNLASYRVAYLYGKLVPAHQIEGSIENKNKIQKEKEIKNIQNERKINLKDLEKLSDKESKSKLGVVIYTFYEPPQDSSSIEIVILDDTQKEKVELITKALGLEKVGFLFSHTSKRENYTLSTNELLTAGEQALEASSGQFNSPFIIIRMLNNEKESAFDAFSLTPQFIEMTAENAILSSDDPGLSAINQSYTVIVEKKESSVVDNDFFIKTLPIFSQSTYMKCDFPIYNRPYEFPPNSQALQSILKKTIGQSDIVLAKALSDLQLLLYLSNVFVSIEDLKQISYFVSLSFTDKGSKALLKEGYKAIIFASAGLSS